MISCMPATSAQSFKDIALILAVRWQKQVTSPFETQFSALLIVVRQNNDICRFMIRNWTKCVVYMKDCIELKKTSPNLSDYRISSE